MEWTPIAALNEDDGENKDGNILDGEGEDADMPSGDAESMVEDAADVPNAVEAALVDAEQLFFMPPSTPVFARTATFDAPLYTPSAGPSPSSSLAARYLNLSPPAPSTSARARSQSRAASPSRRPSLPDPFVDTRPGEAYLLNVETMRREKRRRVQSGDRPLYNVTEQAREAMVSLAYTRAEDARAWDLVPRVGTLERDLALANLDACRASLERAKLMAQCAEAEAQLEYARQSQLEYVKTRLMDERCGREAKAELIWMFEAVWPVQRDSNGRVF
ncbi:hypothetical protein BOTBODRAFT_27146 [Botryobasidium botryosum FD-172 SS1]|uniref:Uncharacterized protein n=1 Tax=Botryobasidium botryosum (strain FD-172 SS1) TaxID=930990 RepID=A0A067N7H2_BOTB1|nr:hypothetical protein BOTBODRAFT_27146 [Botryobasidium botryosum FD-172 SS1]